MLESLRWKVNYAPLGNNMVIKNCLFRGFEKKSSRFIQCSENRKSTFFHIHKQENKWKNITQKIREWEIIKNI